jgi:hypothetical protein
MIRRIVGSILPVSGDFQRDPSTRRNSAVISGGARIICST